MPFRLAHHDPFPGSVVIPRHVVRKLEARVVRAGENECWPYVPDRPFRPVDVPDFEPDPDRHHQIAWRDPETNVRLTIPTHRLALIAEIGPISPDLQAYHLCARSHRCCNPRHLYAGDPWRRADDRALLKAIEAAQGTTEGVVLPRHPRSRMVCEALINGQDPAPISEQERQRLDQLY
ncbi:hypothetical protein ACLBYE_16225 [Methylobacterium sp. A52T]